MVVPDRGTPATTPRARPDPAQHSDSKLSPSSSDKENSLMLTAALPEAVRHSSEVTLQERKAESVAAAGVSATARSGSLPASTKSNHKPFAGSAAKRESVMALGSISHLQAFYAKQGLAAPQAPMLRGATQLALGPAALPGHSNGSIDSKTSTRRSATDQSLAALEGRRGSTTQAAHDQGDAGPKVEEPDVTRSTWKGKLYPDIAKPLEADVERLWGNMMKSLDSTCQQWDLLGTIKQIPLPAAAASLTVAGQDSDISGRSSFDSSASFLDAPKRLSVDSSAGGGHKHTNVPVLLEGTSQTVRDVRNYLFALPPGVMASSTDAKPQSEADPTKPASTSPTLQRRPSLQFRQERSSVVKPKDAFKRQSSFSGLPRPTVKPTASAIKQAHAPSSFVPLATNRRLSRAMSFDGEDGPDTEDGPGTLAAPPPPEPVVVQQPKEDRATQPPPPDPLTIIRTAALDVLGMLKELDLQCRIERRGSQVDVDCTPGKRRTVVRDYSESYTSESTMQRTWSSGDAEPAGETGLAVSYKSEIPYDAMQRGREVVRRYLSTVDSVLARIPPPPRPLRSDGNGPARRSDLPSLFVPTGAVTAALPNESHEKVHISEEALPTWAQHDFQGTQLERLLIMLTDFAPDGEPCLSSLGDLNIRDSAEAREQLLAELADGQLICHAYNAALRRSRRPWGFIPSDDIHDIKRGELGVLRDNSNPSGMGTAAGAAKEGSTDTKLSSGRPAHTWTFRRIENLRRFLAALNLRYDVRVHTDALAGGDARHGRRSDRRERLHFDPAKVARMEGGEEWMGMFEALLSAWLDKVVAEERGGEEA